jgi:amino acid transporter
MTVQQTASPNTALKKNAVGVGGIVFFVLSAQAPLTGIVGASALAIGLGNGAGAPGAYLVVGLVIILFSVGFTAMARHVNSRGGFAALIGAGLGQSVGAGSSWVALLSYNTVQAAMYGLFGASVAGLVQTSTGISIPWWLYVAAAIVVVYVFGSRNIEVGARVLAVLVILEFAILLAFAVRVLITGGAFHGIDAAASFGPVAIGAGAPGLAILFAIASMFGFESTAIYSSEAKDPHRTVPRATYLSVTIIAVFFAFVMWMLVAYYGAANVAPAALQALGSDPASFVTTPLTAMLGTWAAIVAEILLCTSLLAGLLAFHNIVNRYFHAMASDGLLPRTLARTNQHQAPATAAATQSIVVAVIVLPFVVLQMDPVATLFGWLSGVSVAALVVLYTLTSISVIVYFRRHSTDANAWQTSIAPAAAILCMLGELLLIVGNFTSLIGGSFTTALVLLLIVPAAFALGFVHLNVARQTRSTEVVDVAV